MPCRDWPCDDSVKDFALQTEKLDRATSLLCELCGKLEKADILTVYGTKDLLRWWQTHKKLDVKRIAQEKLEAARKTAIKQILTEEERKALEL